jgi:predicted TIM-barrel fold metal-dependent hydrolase
LIGSDYGHVDTSAEIDALKRMKTKGDVRSEVIDKILWDNPKAFYKI